MSEEGKSVGAGRIYILRDPLHKDAIIKIGHTTRKSETRAKEITNATGVPWGFEVLYEENVLDSREAERLVHIRLAAFRVNQRREFFKLPLKDAVRVVFEICMRVNCGVSDFTERIAICVTHGFESQQLKNVLVPVVGGTTMVTLIYSNGSGEVPINLPDAWRVTLTPEFVLSVRDLSGVSDVMIFRGNPPKMEEGS